MRKPVFYDRITLYVTSGHGGPGLISFRREKYIPKGMPDGGDGGDGGDIIFKVNPQLNHLAHLRYKRIFKAGAGKNGMRKRATGKKGENIIIEIPLNTQIKTQANEQIIHSFEKKNETLVFLKGGKGGKGNFHFKSSTRQNPTYAQEGLPGESADIILELKLLADIGLVGFPNVGKSSFLNAFTNSNSPVGDYSFTTLNPFLGVFHLNEYQHLLISDIPGIIEGAHQGKGLGIQFLKHIEKTSYLFYLLDSTSSNPFDDFKKLQKELSEYNPALVGKPFKIIITKIDLNPNQKEITELFSNDERTHLLFLSSKEKIGFTKLTNAMKIIYNTIHQTTF